MSCKIGDMLSGEELDGIYEVGDKAYAALRKVQDDWAKRTGNKIDECPYALVPVSHVWRARLFTHGGWAGRTVWGWWAPEDESTTTPE